MKKTWDSVLCKVLVVAFIALGFMIIRPSAAYAEDPPPSPICQSITIDGPDSIELGEEVEYTTRLTFGTDVTESNCPRFTKNLGYLFPGRVNDSGDYTGTVLTHIFSVKCPPNLSGGTTTITVSCGDIATPKTIRIINPSAQYSITVNKNGGGNSTVSASATSAASGTTIILTATPAEGYSFESWTSTNTDITNPTSATGASFNMPSTAVTVTANFSGSGPSSTPNPTPRTRPRDDDDDDSHEESRTSVAEPSWTPAKAATTIAAEKAEKQQAAGTQMAAVQTLLRTLAITKPTDRPEEARKVIGLDMTKVDILDPSTVNLLVLNNKFEYNIKIPVAGGLTTTVKIPANFNFRPFIKANGTMNIHEVLWSIILSRK